MSETRTTAPAPPRAAIVYDLIRLIGDVVQDWDLDLSGGLREETRLVADLGFQSIDVVMLIGEIHRLYGRRNLPFERLLVRGGSYAPEIRISEVADFLVAHLGPAGDGAGAGTDGR